MEQKLLCVPEQLGDVKNRTLDKYIEEGWHISDISAAGNGLNSCCWVLIERALTK